MFLVITSYWGKHILSPFKSCLLAEHVPWKSLVKFRSAFAVSKTFLVCQSLVSFRRYFPLLSLDVVEKSNRNRQFWAHVLERGESPKIMDDHFQIWLTSEHVTPKLVEFREWRSNRRTGAKYTGLPCINIGGRNEKCIRNRNLLKCDADHISSNSTKVSLCGRRVFADASRAAATESFSSSAMCGNFYLSVIYNLPLTKLDGAAAKSAAETVKMATAAATTTTTAVGRRPGR